MSRNREIWKSYGLAPEADAAADAIMDAILVFADDYPELLLTVAKEAVFQAQELPRRSYRFRAKYAWKKARARTKAERPTPGRGG